MRLDDFNVSSIKTANVGEISTMTLCGMSIFWLRDTRKNLKSNIVLVVRFASSKLKVSIYWLECHPWLVYGLKRITPMIATCMCQGCYRGLLQIKWRQWSHGRHVYFEDLYLAVTHCMAIKSLTSIITVFKIIFQVNLMVTKNLGIPLLYVSYWHMSRI